MKPEERTVTTAAESCGRSFMASRTWWGGGAAIGPAVYRVEPTPEAPMGSTITVKNQRIFLTLHPNCSPTPLKLRGSHCPAVPVPRTLSTPCSLSPPLLISPDSPPLWAFCTFPSLENPLIISLPSPPGSLPRLIHDPEGLPSAVWLGHLPSPLDSLPLDPGMGGGCP